MKNNFGNNLKLAIIFTVFLFVLVFSNIAVAQDKTWATVSPTVFDYKTKARDIINDSLVIKNNTSGKISAYAFVNNISAKDGTMEFLDPSRADHSSSLANWIEITRGAVELSPGEEKKVDLRINVNLRAGPGMYHASIAFSRGSNVEDAQRKISQAPVVLINVEVEEDIREKLQLKSFFADKNIFFGLPASFSFEIENNGNKPLAPAGEIRIYSSRGKEIAVLPLASNAPIKPGEAKIFSEKWSDGDAMGSYKAVLDIEYGNVQRGTLQDTVFFKVLPSKTTIIFLLCGLFVAALAGDLAHRKYIRRRHRKKIAHRQTAVVERGKAPVAESPKHHERHGHVVDLRHHKNTKRHE